MVLDYLFIACVLAVVGVVLLLHHGWVHAYSEDDRARRESNVCVCYFQLSDIRHFETWFLIFGTNGIILGVHGLTIHGIVLAVAVGLLIGLVLLLTWAMVGRDGEETVQRFPALHNVANHETWILVALTNAASFFWLWCIY